MTAPVIDHIGCRAELVSRSDMDGPMSDNGFMVTHVDEQLCLVMMDPEP